MANLTVFNKKVASIKTRNANIKKDVSWASREALSLIVESWDISVCNKFVGAMNGNDRQAMVLFFKALAPFSFDAEKGEFGGISGSKTAKLTKREKSEAAIREFLADESNDFWTWCEANVKTDVKEVDYRGAFKRAAKKAHDKGQVATADMMKLLVESGIDVAELKAAVAALTIESDK